MNILCTICVRGGSSSIKNKNIMKINGKPLIYYTIKQAQKSKMFKRIVVSTDSKKIQNEFQYLSIAIEKTAGDKELEAWGWLTEKIDKYIEENKK